MIFAIPIAFATVATGVALLAAERARLGTGKVKKIAVREARKVQRARSRADKAETRARKSETRERKTEREARKRRRRKRKAAKIPSHKVTLKAEDARPREREREPEKKPTKTTRIRPKKYAQQLYVYVSRMIAAGKASQLGTKGKPNPEVKRLQGGMRRLKKDGIYGTRTRRRGKELTGKSFPKRRTVKPAERKPFTAPEPTQPPPKPTPVEDEGPPLSEAEAPLARGSKRAALDLLLYARGIGKTRAERSRAFGYKGHPNDTVEDAQRDMGGLKVDGIYGRKTRRRGKELTGQRFPIR